MPKRENPSGYKEHAYGSNEDVNKEPKIVEAPSGFTTTSIPPANERKDYPGTRVKAWKPIGRK